MNFKVILFLGIILCVNQNVLSLEEDDIELMKEIQEYLEDVILQYEKLIYSAREEMRLMINNYNTLSVSRIGFIATEMMDIQNTVFSSIQQRALEVNSTTAQCIVDATTELEYIVSKAGASFAEVSGQINFELDELKDFLFFPLVNEYHDLVAYYESDLILLLAYYNSVKDFDYITTKFLFDTIVLDDFFEYLIDDIYIEMVYWNIITNDVSADNFPILQNSLDYFRFNANLIENTLGDCNGDEIEV